MAVEGQTWEQVAAVVKVLERHRTVTVRAAGFLAAVRMAEFLAAALHSDWMVDGNWDPIRTVRNIDDLDMLNDRSFMHFSLSRPLQVANLPPEFSFSADELELQCSQRLRSALHTPYPGFQVILTSLSALCLVVTLITAQACLQAAVLQVAYDTDLPRIATCLRTQSDVEEFLLAGLPKEANNSHFAVISPISERKSPISGPLKLLHTEEIPSRVIAEVRQMVAEFEMSQLKRLSWDEAKKRKFAEIRANTEGKAQKLKGELDQWVSAVLKQTQSLEFTRDSLKNELVAMERDLQAAYSAQNQLKRLVLAVSQAISAFVDPLPLILQAEKQSLAEQRSTLAAFLSEQKVEKQLFALSAVSVQQNSVLTTTVTSSKRYRVAGKLSIIGPDGTTEWRELDLSSGLEVELGSVMKCRTGLYRVSVTKEDALASNVVTFTINESHSLPKPVKSVTKEPYLASLLYTSLGTIEDVEHEIVEKAREGGLASFRRFAATWTNADSSRIQEFLDVCLQTLPTGEEEARTRLESLGFQFLLA